MSEATLDRVLQINEQLRKLSHAGVPIDLGLNTFDDGASEDRVDEIVDRANAALKLRVELGQPLVDAIAAAPELSASYRASLQTWLTLDDPTAAMDSLTVPAQRRFAVNQSMGVSLIQPMLLVVLTFIAFIVLCSFTVPRLIELDAQVWRRPTGVLAILEQVRATMPIWMVVIPVLFVVGWIAWQRRSLRRTVHRWLPGGQRYLDALQYSRYSEQLATFLEHDLPLDQSMRLADPSLGAQIERHESMPPLLRWALTSDLGGEPLPSVLRFVSLTYRQIADQHGVLWRIIAPAFVTALLGGLLVLAYGLSLFVPMIEMLNHIAFTELVH